MVRYVPQLLYSVIQGSDISEVYIVHQNSIFHQLLSVIDLPINKLNSNNNNNNNNMHAHFDCFSGAAGDMMLAATLDAADFLPCPILQSSTDNDDDGNDIKNSDKLLSRITKDLECGLPELKGEFKLSVKRVWRSSGRIAAKKVDVHSIYNHEAAPVPGANKDESKEEEDAHSHTHQHAHQHALNQNAHQHTHQHIHDHQHSSSTSGDDAMKDHTHDHQHSSSTNPNGDDGMKEDPQSTSHSHNHGHSHNHKHSHSHGHDHDSKLRNLPQITKMLQSAPTQHIPKHVATLAIEAFTALAHAEMHTHGAESIDEVHFHEVGAVDSIVDTVGTLLALFHLGVDLGNIDNEVAVSCSPLPLGEGTVWTDHGLLPVPAPATMRLMVGMPTCPGPKGVTGELVTPTAAALLRALTGVSSNNQREGAKHSIYWQSKRIPGRPPNMIPRSVGIGAGSKDFERHPNIIRLILGDTASEQSQSSNVDDIPSEEMLRNGSSKISLESNTDTQKVSEGIDGKIE